MSSQNPPLLANATCDLARFGAAFKYDDIPAAIISRITAHVDTEIKKMGAPFRHASRVKVNTRNGRCLKNCLYSSVAAWKICWHQ